MSNISAILRAREEHDDTTVNLVRLLQQVPDIEEILDAGPKIIDIGAAHGETVKAFRGGGLEDTHGFDADPRFSREFPGVVQTADALSLPLKSGTVDIAISSRLYSDPEFVGGGLTYLDGTLSENSRAAKTCNKVFTEVARVLRSGGIYAISDGFVIPVVGENKEILKIIYSMECELGQVLRRK